MPFNNAMTDVQPQPGSLTGRFGGKKRFENILTDGIGNARSRIFTRENDQLPFSVDIRFQKNGA